MTTKLDLQPIETVDCDALIAVAFEGEKSERFGELTADLYESKEFAGKPLELALLHRPAGLKARRLLLVGGGKREKFDSATLRKTTGAAFRHLKSKSARDIAIVLDSGFSSAGHVSAAVEGAILGDYEPDALKSDKKDVKVVDRFTVAVPGGDPALEAARKRGEIIAESNFSRLPPPTRSSRRALSPAGRCRSTISSGLPANSLDS